MAIPVSFVIEVFITILALYFREGDFSDKLTAIGLFILVMPIVYVRQFYFIDTVQNFIQIYYPTPITQLFIIALALGALNTISLMFADLTGKTLDQRIQEFFQSLVREKEQ